MKLLVVFALILVFCTSGCIIMEDAVVAPDTADTDTCGGGPEMKALNLQVPAWDTFMPISLPGKKVEVVKNGRVYNVAGTPMFEKRGDVGIVHYGREQIRIRFSPHKKDSCPPVPSTPWQPPGDVVPTFSPSPIQ